MRPGQNILGFRDIPAVPRRAARPIEANRLMMRNAAAAAMRMKPVVLVVMSIPFGTRRLVVLDGSIGRGEARPEAPQ